MPDGSHLAAVAAHGLPGAGVSATTWSKPLGDVEWSRLCAEVTDQRLAGVLADAIGAGALPATDGQAAAAFDSARDAAARDLLLERLLLRWTEVLETAGIPYRVLKGAAVAHLAYPSPELRSFGDVDLLVPSEHLDAAVAAFVRVGLRRRTAEVRAGFDRRFGKGVTLLTTEGWELDLHRMLAPGPYGYGIDAGSLFAAPPADLPLAGRTLPCLPASEMFLHACCHAVLGDAEPRWSALRDVVQLAHHPDIEIDAILERARAWKIEAVVARAVDVAGKRLGVRGAGDISVWAGGVRPSRRDEHLLALHGGQRSYALLAAASLRTLPTWADRTRFALSLAFPSSSGRRPLAERLRRGLRVVVGKPVPR